MIYKYITAKTKKIIANNENNLIYFQDNKKINGLQRKKNNAYCGKNDGFGEKKEKKRSVMEK